MLPLELQTPAEILEDIGRRAQVLRVERGWTQRELSRRSGVALTTLKQFERTGKITLERLITIAVVLGAVRPLGDLFSPGPARTLDELERRATLPKRAPRTRRKARDAQA
ncbi:MAG TPA: helix-turn-helix transcriptional regulator [Longimicrobium sp.]|nr:helix-turn-helix transcriptional regulator [Longimicrobium sp.]